MAARKKDINLLPKDETQGGFFGGLLKWALSAGRYIVIATELVVIGSFLGRFSLDRQVTDLDEAIAQKQAVLASYGDLEKNVRSAQHRLELIDQLDQTSLGVKTFADRIATFTPVDVKYDSVEFSEVTMTLKGTAFSEAGFRTLLATLREAQVFEQVQVRQASSAGSQGSGIDFEIGLVLKKVDEAKGEIDGVWL